MAIRTRRRTPNDRPQRICLYARYSTEEQDETSIPDQFAYCKKHLELLGIDLSKATIDEFSDPETSGEIVYRPGINQVRDGISARRWSLLVCEDSSRLFRNLPACCELVETAFDNGVRVIAINDDVDTAEEDWDDRLYESAAHHAKDNRYTSRRIKRKLESLWAAGAAIGLVVPGYKRIRPDDEVITNGRRLRRKPKFDEIDPERRGVIVEAFERIAAGEPSWSVADWLTEQGLPKCRNAKHEAWTPARVNHLIRRTVYRGHDVYRDTVSQKVRRTGKRVMKRNDRELVLTREMPHLRIVSDALWYAANRKIDDRTAYNRVNNGDDHPLAGIPRDSRFPLSTLFVCDCCNGKMHADGRNEGGYRCGGARCGDCWNKATALQDFAHHQISKTVVGELLALDGVPDALVTHIGARMRDDEPRQAEERRLGKEIQVLTRACDRLGEACAMGDSGELPKTLIAKLRAREHRLAEAEAEWEALQHNRESPPEVTSDEIEQRIGEFAERLLELDRSSGILLARIIDGKIRAIPCLQFGSNKVVLRARFTFHPVGILPDHLLAALGGAELENVAAVLPAKEITVDLFEPSIAPRYAMDAVELMEENPAMRLQDLADCLAISKRGAHLALQLGLNMRETGIEDPFIELSERPAHPSRWRDRRWQETEAG